MVVGAMRWAESATATARCRNNSASLIGSLAAASGWWGATANTKARAPSSRLMMPGTVPRSMPMPIARSTWPEASASQVPVMTSGAQAQPGARAAVQVGVDVGRAGADDVRPRPRHLGHAHGIERLAELEHGEARDHAVDRHAELGLPAGRDALDPVRHRVHLVEQAPTFAQQFLAGGSEAGLARAPVEEQHIERVFELADTVGERRRHLAQLARRRGETAGARDHIHHGQGIRGQDIAAGAHRGFRREDSFILFE